ncbi:MAG: copper chaperone CopZ [Candidatus Deianiraeaceae bacterium]|jgi:copper chaperone CopZ
MFKNLLIASVLIGSFGVSSVFAKTITVDVNGLVCEFCASTIEKVFKKKDEVESIKVDLESKIVTIDFKENQNLSNEIIKETILNNGYNVEKINR